MSKVTRYTDQAVQGDMYVLDAAVKPLDVLDDFVPQGRVLLRVVDPGEDRRRDPSRFGIPVAHSIA